MKIALLGYGKMGKAIEQIATQRGHEIVLKIDSPHTDYDITLADIAIEFSTPQSAYQNITHSLSQGVPVVAGTTGWLAHYDEAAKVCEEHHTAFLYASNFSVGVNIFFALNKTLAKLSEVDTIEIKHTAHSRTGFALGAVIAAEWLVNKKGVHTMQEVLGI